MKARNGGRRKRRPLLIILIVLVLLGAAGFAVYWFFFRSVAGQGAVWSDQTYTVEELSSSESVEVSGNVEAVRSRDLVFSSSGQVESVSVAVGRRVAAGDVVATLSGLDQQYAVEQAQYDLDMARLDGDQRTIELKEVALELRQRDLERLTLRSPFAGTVVSVGVAAGDWIGNQDIVARIIDTTALIATVNVDEMDASSVRYGQTVTFHFDAYPDLELTGLVSSLPLESTVTQQGIAVLPVEVRINWPPSQILPGFTFVGNIQTSPVETILVLDKAAVLTMGDRTVVFPVVDFTGAVAGTPNAVAGTSNTVAGTSNTAAGTPNTAAGTPNAAAGTAATTGVDGTTDSTGSTRQARRTARAGTADSTTDSTAAALPNAGVDTTASGDALASAAPAADGSAMPGGPQTVEVEEYDTTRYRVLSGLAAGDVVRAAPTMTASDSGASGSSGFNLFGLTGGGGAVMFDDRGGPPAGFDGGPRTSVQGATRSFTGSSSAASGIGR